MAREGRIEGRVNGDAYELVQRGAVRQSIPLAQVHGDERLKRAIHLNKWEPLP
jgi:hypothetical protein